MGNELPFRANMGCIVEACNGEFLRNTCYIGYGNSTTEGALAAFETT